MINDDLGAFDDLPRIFANDAEQSIGDVFYDVLNAGQTAGFFAAGNDNLLTGGSSVLSADSLATAIKQLREMTDSKGKLLNLAPYVLLLPPALEFEGRKQLNSAQLGVTDGSPIGNPMQGVARLVVEGRIGAAGGGTDTNWYLFADQPGAMQVAFLGGTTPAPMISFHDINTDPAHLNVSWRVAVDHGSARGDHRFAIKSAGA